MNVDLLLRFSFATQVIAAFAIFLFGYLAILASLITCLFIARGICSGAKRVWTHARKSAAPDASASPSAGSKAPPQEGKLAA